MSDAPRALASSMSLSNVMVRGLDSGGSHVPPVSRTVQRPCREKRKAPVPTEPFGGGTGASRRQNCKRTDALGGRGTRADGSRSRNLYGRQPAVTIGYDAVDVVEKRRLERRRDGPPAARANLDLVDRPDRRDLGGGAAEEHLIGDV